MRVEVPRQSIYRRLGSCPSLTRISADRQRTVDEAIDEAVQVIQLQGAYCRAGITERSGNQVLLDTGDRFVSRDIVTFLQRCDEVFCMAATSGPDIVDQIQRLSTVEDTTKAVIFDAVASEMTDAALQWLMEYAQRQMYRQQRLLMKKRFSCGYGDFSLAHQKVFYTLLHLSELHITLTEQYILIPEKSVTALSGIYSRSASSPDHTDG